MYNAKTGTADQSKKLGWHSCNICITKSQQQLFLSRTAARQTTLLVLRKKRQQGQVRISVCRCAVAKRQNVSSVEFYYRWLSMLVNWYNSTFSLLSSFLYPFLFLFPCTFPFSLFLCSCRILICGRNIKKKLQRSDPPKNLQHLTTYAVNASAAVGFFL